MNIDDFGDLEGNMIERLLLDEGWVLRGFESERITLH